jgi:hypothetical protein
MITLLVAIWVARYGAAFFPFSLFVYYIGISNGFRAMAMANRRELFFMTLFKTKGLKLVL